MKITVEVFRKDNAWHIYFHLPRWLLDELEKSAVFMKIASSLVHLDTDEATILYEGLTLEQTQELLKRWEESGDSKEKPE